MFSNPFEIQPRPLPRYKELQRSVRASPFWVFSYGHFKESRLYKMPFSKSVKVRIGLEQPWHSWLNHSSNILPLSCQPDTRPDIHPNCTTEEETLYEAQCGNVILSDRFQPCHSLVPPEAFLGNCIYDMCEYNGMQATLCDNVEAYAAACQSAGVTISWRNNTFCRTSSPTRSQFEWTFQFFSFIQL